MRKEVNGRVGNAHAAIVIELVDPVDDTVERAGGALRRHVRHTAVHDEVPCGARVEGLHIVHGAHRRARRGKVGRARRVARAAGGSQRGVRQRGVEACGARPRAPHHTEEATRHQ
eukprot:249731-Chlamydomonas_euryale.AAC.2